MDFWGHLRRSHAVVPTVGHGVPAMSEDRRARLLASHDPVLVVEAASTVLAEAERGDTQQLIGRLPPGGQTNLRGWMRRVEQEGMTVGPALVSPLALLAATTLALAQSEPGKRSDDARDEVANRLVQVGLAFNADVLDTRDLAKSGVVEAMTRAALWREIEDEDWMVWSGELVQDLMLTPKASDARKAFKTETGISVGEWWARGLGERSTRAVQGAGGWVGASGVEPRIEEGWYRVATCTLDDAVDTARKAVSRRTRRAPPTLNDLFDLGRLAARPVVAMPDGRRVHVCTCGWELSVDRCFPPA